MKRYEILMLVVSVFLLAGVILCIRQLFSKINIEWDIRIKNRKWHVDVHELVKKYRKGICIAGVLISITVILFLTRERIGYYLGLYEKWESTLTIAHAGGEIDGYEYSNSREAILQNYEKGHRTFEIDFTVTSDGALVAKHDWDMVVQDEFESGYVPAREEFLSAPIYGKYTPMALEDVCRLMEEYPDIWIVTDIKDANADEMEQIVDALVKTVKDSGKERVLDRFVIQVYNEDGFEKVERIYPFRNWIFTLYQCWDGNEETFPEYAKFCYRNDIDTITMWDSWVTPRIIEMAREYEIDICVHTINDVKMAQEYIDMGVTAIYTDIVTPDELRRN